VTDIRSIWQEAAIDADFATGQMADGEGLVDRNADEKSAEERQDEYRPDFLLEYMPDRIYHMPLKSWKFCPRGRND
jgi:hypothetical protein